MDTEDQETVEGCEDEFEIEDKLIIKQVDSILFNSLPVLVGPHQDRNWVKQLKKKYPQVVLLTRTQYYPLFGLSKHLC